MKGDMLYLIHIKQSIEKIQEYVKDCDEASFHQRSMVQDAVIRNIEIMGEATKKISSITTGNNPQVPWKGMAGMRDKLIHHYHGVDLNLVWATIQEDIPFIESEILDIIALLEPDIV